MVGAFVTQYFSPPKVANRSDMATFIKDNRELVRPGAWTKSDDIKTMAALRQEEHNHRLKLHSRIDGNERKANRNTDVLVEKEKDHELIRASIDKLEEALNHGPSRSEKDITHLQWRLLQLENDKHNLP